MSNDNVTRRKLLERSIQLSLGGVLVAAATVQTAAAGEKVCADLEAMDSGQRSIRESLNYVEQSKDPKKTCGNCGFFVAKGDGCGDCMIFTGPANAMGHCDSWSAKEG